MGALRCYHERISSAGIARSVSRGETSECL